MRFLNWLTAFSDTKNRSERDATRRHRRRSSMQRVWSPGESSKSLEVLEDRRLLTTNPTLDVISDVSVDEDAAEQTVNLSGITDGGDGGQPIQITASSDTPGLIPDPTVTYTTPDATGSLAFTPVADQHGSATITVTVEDGGLDGDLGTAVDNNTFSRSFAVTVNEVNDAPTIGGGGTSLTLESTQVSPSFFYGMTSGDFNSDGRDDVAGTYYFTPTAVHVTLGSEDHSNSTDVYSLTATIARKIVAVDIDNDNDEDLLVSSNASNGRLHILTNDGQGAFTVTSLDVPGSNPTDFTTGDFDGDGYVDVGYAVSFANSWTKLLNDQSGGFTVEDSYDINSPDDLAAGDFDDDGDIDVAAVSLNTTSLIIFENDGSGNFTEIQSISSGAFPTAVNTGDFDGDDDIDIVVSNQTSDTLTIFTNNGSGTFAQDSVTTLGSAGAVDEVSIVDWNSDGIDDIIALSSGETDSEGDPASAIFAFSPATNSTIQQQVPDIGIQNAVGDFDGDGVLEVAASTYVTATTPATLSYYEFSGPLVEVTLDEDSGESTTNLVGITAGPGESQDLSVTATSDDPSLIPHPTVTYTSPNSTASIAYTPVADQNGTATITITVEDGGLDGDLATGGDNGTFSRTIDVTVTPLNDAPVAVDDSPSVDEDDSVMIAVLSNDIEVDGDTLSIDSFTQGSNGTVVDNGDGTLTYSPNAEFSGSDSFTYTMNDGQGESDTATVTVTINPVNDDPTLDAISNVTVDEDAAEQTVNLAGITAGGETQPLQVTASSDTPGLIPNPTVTYTTPDATGSLAFTPVADQNGTATITVTVEDGGLDGNLATQGDNSTFSRTFDVTVNPIGDDPVANDDTATVDEDDSVIIDVLTND
ncbi:MAG: hypothetical protein CMJ77_25510, partial [Planctomycetaceae bacterium]|nr:hypothetical protein [Planctomycetaceae bacterium]